MKIKCPHCNGIAEYDVRDGCIECLSDACWMRRFKFGHNPIGNLAYDLQYGPKLRYEISYKQGKHL